MCVISIPITSHSSVADKIRNFLLTCVSHDKDLDQDFANIALDDDDEDLDGPETKGLKYMQQLVCISLWYHHLILIPGLQATDSKPRAADVNH